MDAIQKITIPYTARDDKIIWIKDSKGKFLVKSALKSIFKSGSEYPYKSQLAKVIEVEPP